MTHRLEQAFSNPKKKLLSIFTTAGFPHLESTIPVCKALESSGVDMIEIGFPFSDPLADGPTIQKSNTTALENGMNLKKLFEQLEELRPQIKIPVLLMGYLNPIIQFGFEAFCQKCNQVGIDGLILPDLPLDEYQNKYKELFEKNQLKMVFLITSETSPERIKTLSTYSSGFLYVVSTTAVTGKKLTVDQQKTSYFQRIQNMNLSTPLVIGFGIRDKESYEQSVQYANGGIIGSAFIELLQEKHEDLEQTISDWVRSIRD